MSTVQHKCTLKKLTLKKLSYLGKGEANCEPRLSERYEEVVRADGIPAT